MAAINSLVLLVSPAFLNWLLQTVASTDGEEVREKHSCYSFLENIFKATLGSQCWRRQNSSLFDLVTYAPWASFLEGIFKPGQIEFNWFR